LFTGLKNWLFAAKMRWMAAPATFVARRSLPVRSVVMLMMRLLLPCSFVVVYAKADQ
jgi:hypothetical protein